MDSEKLNSWGRNLALVCVFAGSIAGCDGSSGRQAPIAPTTPAAPAAIDSDGDGYDKTQDCDDDDAHIHPGRKEICNGTDDNCNGEIDEGPWLLQTGAGRGAPHKYYIDVDGDLDGDPTHASIVACDGNKPQDWVISHSDCNDSDPSITGKPSERFGFNGPFSGKEAVPADNDCDGSILEEVSFTDWPEHFQELASSVVPGGVNGLQGAVVGVSYELVETIDGDYGSFDDMPKPEDFMMENDEIDTDTYQRELQRWNQGMMMSLAQSLFGRYSASPVDQVGRSNDLGPLFTAFDAMWNGSETLTKQAIKALADQQVDYMTKSLSDNPEALAYMAKFFEELNATLASADQDKGNIQFELAYLDRLRSYNGEWKFYGRKPSCEDLDTCMPIPAEGEKPAWDLDSRDYGYEQVAISWLIRKYDKQERGDTSTPATVEAALFVTDYMAKELKTKAEELAASPEAQQ